MTIKTTSQLIKTKQKANPSVVKHLTSSFVLATLLFGCASVDKQGNEGAVEADNVAAAAESAQQDMVVAGSSDVEPEVEAKAEANADAMMASLAKKSKFDEPEKLVESEVLVSEDKPKEPQVKSLPKVKKTEPKVAKKAKVVKVLAKETVEVKKEAEIKETPKKNVSSAGAKPLNATIKDLPIDYDIWRIRKGERALGKDLVISTPTWDMGESEYLSQIWLTIMDDKLLVNSSSDIYAPEGKAGIKLNGGELVPFDRIVESNIGVLEGEHWLDLLATGGEIEIFMGFFPDRTPKSGIYKSSLELDSFGRVAATYKMLK